MKQLLLILFVALAVSSGLLLPESAGAQADPHTCYYCHDLHGNGTGGIPLSSFSSDSDLCLSCHADTAPATYLGIPVPKGVAVHAGALHTGGDVTSCWDCHDHFGETFGNLSLIPQLRVSKYPLGAPTDKTILFTARTGPTNSFADGDATIDGVCEVCHTATINHLADGSATAHYAQADCTTCHSHAQGFPRPTCPVCHNLAQPTAAPTRRAVTPEFDLTSHHIDWQTAGYASALEIPEADCKVCHDQTNHKGGQVWLNDVDNPANGPYNPSVAADLVNFCTACHDANAANGVAPFSDGIKPPVIDKTTWLTTRHGVNLTTGGCLECHTSGHGKDRAELALACETCHGPNNPPAAYVNNAKYARTHVDPNFTPWQWDMPCKVCHTPHTNVTNKYYYPPFVANAGDPHAHVDTSDIPTSVVGINIKLVGRVDDGSGIAKVQTPLRVVGEGSAGPCTNSDIELQVNLPPFANGDGVLHTVMVGDRIQLNNAGVNFPDVYRVKETSWDGVSATGWICFDNPVNPAATTGGLAYLQSAGWYQKPLIGLAEWNSGTASLRFSGPSNILYGIHSIQINDWINVTGVSNTGYNGLHQVTDVIGNKVSFLLSDPGGTGTGGEVEYVGSVKTVQNITVNAPPPNPDHTITTAVWSAAQGPKPNRAEITIGTHGYLANGSITVSGVNPTGYNGTYTVYSITATTVVYALSPNPGAYLNGGTVPDVRPVVGDSYLILEMHPNSSASILNIKPATTGLLDGDQITLYDVSPVEYNGRYEVFAIDTAASPPTITLRCGPLFRTTLGLPACNIPTYGAYMGGGMLQSSATYRPMVYESRGKESTQTSLPKGYTHSFANSDSVISGQDGWKEGPCELCHTLTANHPNDDFSGHNDGATCVRCHFHEIGFDKGNFGAGDCPRPNGICPTYN